MLFIAWYGLVRKFVTFVRRSKSLNTFLSMIVYRNTKSGFVNDVRSNSIASIIENEFAAHNISHNNDSEYRSWANSLQYLRNVVDVPQLDDECQVAIEYQIPLTSKRVDFLISGIDDTSHNNVVVIELKQWETSGKTSRPDIVTAFTGGAPRAVVHPSYQAYSYAKTIESFNENVAQYGISLHPCAYLHNYKESNRGNIDCSLYKEALEMAPYSWKMTQASSLSSSPSLYAKRETLISCI